MDSGFGSSSTKASTEAGYTSLGGAGDDSDGEGPSNRSGAHSTPQTGAGAQQHRKNVTGPGQSAANGTSHSGSNNGGAAVQSSFHSSANMRMLASVNRVGLGKPGAAHSFTKDSITLNFPVSEEALQASSHLNASVFAKETFHQLPRYVAQGGSGPLQPASVPWGSSPVKEKHGGEGAERLMDEEPDSLVGPLKLDFRNHALEKNYRIWQHSVFENATRKKYLSFTLLELGFVVTGLIIVAIEDATGTDFSQEIYLIARNTTIALEQNNTIANITQFFPDECDAARPLYCTSDSLAHYFDQQFFFHLFIAVFFAIMYLFLKIPAPRRIVNRRFPVCTPELQWRYLAIVCWVLVITLQGFNFFQSDNSIFQSNFALPAGMQLVFYHMSAVMFCGLQFKYTLILLLLNTLILVVLWIVDVSNQPDEFFFILFPLIYSIILFAVFIVILTVTFLASERWSRHTYMLFLRLTQLELETEQQMDPFSQENIAKFVNGRTNEKERTNEAMKALRERPRGPSLLVSPSHSSQQFAKHRYTVASHELYLGKIFAAGGSGNVYKAHYRGRIVAAKEIVTTDTRSGSYSELSNEAMILQHIDQHKEFHPYLVEFRGLCKHNDVHQGRTRLMLIMEYCESSLDKIIGTPPPAKSHKPSVRAVDPLSNQADMRYLCFMLLQLVDSVAFLHSLDIVHRDLKTDNVFLKHIPNDGVFYKFVVGHKAANDVERILGRKPEHILMPKLGDYGLTRILHGDDKLEPPDRGQGTGTYMPPETLWWCALLEQRGYLSGTRDISAFFRYTAIEAVDGVAVCCAKGTSLTKEST
eukprot:INCI16328.3.p1 GENE.INCI16328.3~~INCI16328.3.p1  ORF type:complete len:813 (+),score=134.80 INCI16328.3:268-2706(+)